MTTQVRQYLKVVATRWFAANLRVGGDKRVYWYQFQTVV
jgi:hypothetical protein